jgi:hypothetical protein
MASSSNTWIPQFYPIKYALAFDSQLLRRFKSRLLREGDAYAHLDADILDGQLRQLLVDGLEEAFHCRLAFDCERREDLAGLVARSMIRRNRN